MNILKLSMLLVIFTAFTFLPAPTVLEHKYKVGDAYEWTQTTTQSMKQTIPGMGDNTTETKSESALLIKIIELTKTGAKAEVKLSRVKVDTKSPFATITLDSEGDATQPFNKVLKAITSTTFIAYISKAGAVEKMEGLDKYQTNITALALEGAAQASGKQVADQFASETALKLNIEQSLLQYPEKKVNVGDTWNTSSAAPMSIPIRTDNTWKLAAIDGQVLSLENDGVVVTSDSTKEFSANGFRALANMKGRVASRAKANLATGMPTEIKGVSEIKGSITVLAGNGIPEDMEIPTEIITETSTTVTKK